MALFRSQSQLDSALRNAARSGLPGMTVHVETLPGYRFVDIYRAIEGFCQSHDYTEEFDCQNPWDLSTIMFQANHTQGYPLQPAAKTIWDIGPDSTETLPQDHFWVTYNGDSNQRIVLRLRCDDFQKSSILELAIGPDGDGDPVMRRLMKDSKKTSIHRNQIISLGFYSGTREEYGDVEKVEHLTVAFSDIETVDDENIVLDDDQKRLLQRNVIDLSARRDILKKHGVPTRRGILLYGPPGTGKTFACRHICHQMTDTTRILLTGSALGQIGAVFGLARMLQPAVVFIEDADLMFTSRDINLYSSTLGELMDQLDGLTPDEEISVVMTTNAIDRMEAALKDRPGRISQCIYMGAPSDDLRKRFLRHQLRDQNTAELNFDKLVRASDGVTHAFLKEWSFRAIQIATERLCSGTDVLTLLNNDFSEALDEMQTDAQDPAGRIVGFRATP